MKVLDSVQVYFHEYFLTKKMRSNKDMLRNPVNLQKAKTIGILFDATKINSQEAITAYAQTLKKSGKKVELLAYVDDKKEHKNFIFKYFNRKDINWFLEPNNSIVSSFISKEFDILISLHLHPNLPLEYISSLSKAHLRVGQYRDEKKHCYDLMIDTSDVDDLKNFIGQVDFFLKTINKNV